VGSEPSLEYCELSDIGRRRANNQDASAVMAAESGVEYRRRGWLFLVADGMGAHAAGERASELASEQVPLAYEKKATYSPPYALKSSIRHANTEIHSRGESSPDLKGMGTTCSVLVIVPRGALVGHVGDSRVYRVRDHSIAQLSRDHSLAWEVEAARAASGGDAAQAPALQSPPKNIITRSLGPHGRVEVDVEGPFPVAAGDVFVLCSDGLSGQVADEEIGCFATALPPAEAAAALLGLALVRGAPDNVTLIVARAGPGEQTTVDPNAKPWPLTEPDTGGRDPDKKIPVAMLILAAVGLFGALIFNPRSELMKAEGLLGSILGDGGGAVGFALTGLMGLLAVAGIMGTVLALLGPEGRRIRTLAVGQKLGKGPYREYGCEPSADLVEGIVASVESAADGLSDAERQEALKILANARQKAGSGDFTAALSEAARGIDVYRRSVEAARNDDTIRTDDR